MGDATPTQARETAAPIGVASVLLTVLLLAGSWPLPAQERGGYAPSRFREALDEIAERAHEKKWKRLEKESLKLLQEVLDRAWYSRDLEPVVAELALYRALAHSAQGERDAAIWYWHVALNVDPAIGRKDLSPFGEAAELLLEFPLRERGEAPVGFDLALPPFDRSFEPPSEPEPTVPEILRNSALAAERVPPLRVEVVLDAEGRVHRPVLLSDTAHPIVVYAMLDALYHDKKLRPAHLAGIPRATLVEMALHLHVVRW